MKQTISVVTICFNNLDDLIQTCLSVDSQVTPPDEHLIVDGSSTKEIFEWLTHNQQPLHRNWIHERDKGISDAFNKGVKQASGTIIHLLNSGDKYFINNAIEEAKKVFTADPKLMWTHSLYVQHRGEVDVVTGSPFDEKLLWKGMRTVAHPTMFVKKELYDRHGLFNEHFKIAMDYDFLLRIRKEKFHFIKKPLIYFLPGGASNLQFKKGLAEVKKSYQTHIGKNAKLQLWQSRQRLLTAAMQTSLGKWLFKLKNKQKINITSKR